MSEARFPGLKVRVSVCTTHLNEWPAVRNFLDSLLPQLPRDAELVMVDAGSRRSVQAFLLKASRHNPQLRVLVEPGCTRGRGRDRAWREARGRILLHTDSDRTWKPDAWPKIEMLIPKLGLGPLKLRSQLGRIGLGGFLLKREHLAAVDGYDATLQYFEDTDLELRLRARFRLWDEPFEAYAHDDKTKMRRPAINLRYYRDMFRDGARMGHARAYLEEGSRGRLPRLLLAKTVGAWAYARGRRLPRARSVQEGAQSLA